MQIILVHNIENDISGERKPLGTVDGIVIVKVIVVIVIIVVVAIMVVVVIIVLVVIVVGPRNQSIFKPISSLECLPILLPLPPSIALLF